MRYQVRDPQGNLHIIEGPDGASPEEIVAAAQRTIPQQSDPTKGMTTGEKFLAGAGQAMTSAGRGIKQAMDVPAQALERAFGTFRPLGMPSAAESAQETTQNIAEAQKVDAPLMRSGAAKAGGVAGGIASFLPTMLIPGANTLAGAAMIGGGSSALMTPGSLKDRATAGAFGAAGGAAGKVAGDKLGQWAINRATSRQAAGQAAAAENAVRDATLRSAQEAGYVVPPATVNPSLGGRVLESIGGKAQTAQMASLKNQRVTDNLVRKELNLPQNAPLNMETLKSIRAAEGKIYEKVASAGRITTDDQFKMDLLAMSEVSDRIKLDFPKAQATGAKEVADLTDSLAVDAFDARSAIERIKSLRADGNDNLSFLVAKSDPAKAALGRAQINAANALEDQVKRHLESQGQKSLADAFDAARVRIAKTYSVQRALNEDTGHVNARNLASQLKKGKKLSGGLEAGARFANAFPQAAQDLKGSPGVSALDIFGGMGLGALSGGLANPVAAIPAAVALPLTRHAARAGVLSGPGQRMFASPPNYAPGLLGNVATDVIGGAGMLGLPLGLLGANLSQ